MGCITAVWIICRFLNGAVYSYHGSFRFGSGFMPFFVKFHGSLMAHGYGSEKLRVVTARFNRGFETVKSPAIYNKFRKTRSRLGQENPKKEVEPIAPNSEAESQQNKLYKNTNTGKIKKMKRKLSPLP